MSKNDRLTDIYPYTRKNAEHLIRATKEFLAANTEYKSLANSFVKPGDELKFTPYVEEFMVGELTDEIEGLIGNSFPELLPLKWENTEIRSQS